MANPADRDRPLPVHRLQFLGRDQRRPATRTVVVQRRVRRVRRSRDDDGREDDPRGRRQRPADPPDRADELRPADAEARHDRELRPVGLDGHGVVTDPSLRANAEVVMLAPDGSRARALSCSTLRAGEAQGAAAQRQGRHGRDRGVADGLRVADGQEADGVRPRCPKPVQSREGGAPAAGRRAFENEIEPETWAKVQFNPETLKVELRQPDADAGRSGRSDRSGGAPVRRRGHDQAEPAAVVRRHRAGAGRARRRRRRAQADAEGRLLHHAEGGGRQAGAAGGPLHLGIVSVRRHHGTLEETLEFFSPRAGRCARA